MNTLSIFSSDTGWRDGVFPTPWATERISIHAHLTALMARGEDVNAVDLPDEERDGSDIRFAPGMLDNVFGKGEEAHARAVVQATRQVVARPTRDRIGRLCDLLVEHRTLGLVDEAIPLLIEACLDWGRVGAFFGWLAETCPDREPVKFAIAMLGCIDGSTYRDLFLTFGRHEEFTKFSTVALLGSLPEAEATPVLWDLARALDGWGRVDLILRLAEDADAEARHWLVREGFRNSIMYEYLAWPAAHHGRLLAQLRAPGAADDPALLDGASEILAALVSGGPAEDMSNYTDGATASLLWLDLIAAAPPSLVHGQGVRALRDQAEVDLWTDSDREAISAKATAYLARTDLREAVEAVLGDLPDDAWSVQSLAPEVGVDTWPYLFDAQSSSAAAYHWFGLMQTEDRDRIAAVVALAEAQLPLDRWRSGPGLETGFGPDWKINGALDFVVQELRKFPGIGWSLISVALGSPVIRHRNMAVQALDAWGPDAWPGEALPALRRAVAAEPDGSVREDMEALLPRMN